MIAVNQLCYRFRRDGDEHNAYAYGYNCCWLFVVMMALKIVMIIAFVLTCRTLALLEEAEPSAFVQLKAAATVLQKHWRGIQVSIVLLTSAFE